MCFVQKTRFSKLNFKNHILNIGFFQELSYFFKSLKILKRQPPRPAAGSQKVKLKKLNKCKVMQKVINFLENHVFFPLCPLLDRRFCENCERIISLKKNYKDINILLSNLSKRKNRQNFAVIIDKGTILPFSTKTHTNNRTTPRNLSLRFPNPF